MIILATVVPVLPDYGKAVKVRESQKTCRINKCFREQKRQKMKNQPTHPLTLVLILVLVLNGCTGDSAREQETRTNSPQGSSKAEHWEKTHPEHARLFSIEYKKDAKIVRIKNPFDTTRALKTYLLVKEGVRPGTNLPEGQMIKIPVQKVALAYATHVGFFKELGLLGRVNGISQKKYIKNKQVTKAVKEGRIKEFGPSHHINTEKLLQVGPELLFVAPFKDNRYEKIRDLGIPIAINSSYMETTPLARAEWIKFISYFFNRERKARQIFDSVAHHYQRLTRKVEHKKDPPTIFSGKKIGQTWYVPGGNSYMASFFKDAGARYLWEDNRQSGSLPLDFETVFYRASDADFWCIKENFKHRYTYAQLGSENVHYSEFDAFQNRQIIFCNTHSSPYYEEGILEPNVILADLINILHPGLLSGHRNKYYQLLNEE